MTLSKVQTGNTAWIFRLTISPTRLINSVLLLARNNNLAIFALQETHCKADSWLPKLAGYKVFSVPAAERGSVGLALAIKTGIPSTLLEKSENWIISEVKMANCDWVVANIYFPSGGMNHAV
jgi:exonuclease III